MWHSGLFRIILSRFFCIMYSCLQYEWDCTSVARTSLHLKSAGIYRALLQYLVLFCFHDVVYPRCEGDFTSVALACSHLESGDIILCVSVTCLKHSERVKETEKRGRASVQECVREFESRSNI